MERLRVDGKFFRSGTRRVFLRMVTYGPFPGGWEEKMSDDFGRIKEAGFEAIRLYQWPSRVLLDAAEAAGLWVFAGIKWPQAQDFFRSGTLIDAEVGIGFGLANDGEHPALAGVFVANEVPADLARWMGPARVRRALEELIALGKQLQPELIWCYGNYPQTEYLEPGNADITAMNVYLENEEDYRAYLRRLNHIAGDRPVLISEFGLDSRRNGTARQAETLAWAIQASRESGAAGITIYAWSDRWQNAGTEVLDWDFGLTDRSGADKPALVSVSRALAKPVPADLAGSSFSVIICTRNGAERIGNCLRAVTAMQGAEFEIIVVDDGSQDGTSALIARDFPRVKLLQLDPCGLSAARNAGAGAASGEVLAFTDDDCQPDRDWLLQLSRCFADGWDAAGGPNLPPPPTERSAAVVAAAPGAASHVMLDDAEAEHVPGCNLAVRRSVFFAIGGFDPLFHTAGDDVDFCWRLGDNGYRIGFSASAFVWHHRRSSLSGYLRQQSGYGRAEAMLMKKHPRRFSPSGDAIWRGVIYSGGAVRVAGDAVIYHGPMGMAGYQGVITRMQPLRELDPCFNTASARRMLRGIAWLAPRVRSWTRIRRFRGPVKSKPEKLSEPNAEFALWTGEHRDQRLRMMLDLGWTPGAASDNWDLEKDGTRLLIASEPGEEGKVRTLFRVWGDPTIIPDLDQAERF